MTLTDWGWTPREDQHWAALDRHDDLTPGRVVEQFEGLYTVRTAAGERSARPAGRLRHTAGHSDLPVVGDWVALEAAETHGDAAVRAVLPRRTAITRKEAGGRTAAQVLAANVDLIALVTGLDGDFNLSRIERYVTLAWESGAQPLLLLNKADTCGDVAERMAGVAAVAPGVPALAVSAARGDGVDALAAHLRPGRTAVLLGSSGVGKSTLTNRLLGAQRMATSEVRADDSRGRHTTTHRALFRLPSGALLIDTPGMRELQLWDAGDHLDRTYADVQDYARGCRFRDCTHTGEPGCAVAEAITAGKLDDRRLDRYLKLQREQAHLDRRRDALARKEEQRRWKGIAKQIRRHYKERGKP
jgi:ribosome biogenesis GTPase